MIYCINPNCRNRQNPEDVSKCLSCNISLIINDQYRLVQPLRSLEEEHNWQIFEVEYQGVKKVLKVLTRNIQYLLDLFEREASLLRDLNHVGIPRLEPSGYFTFMDSCQELRCLVMERIEGQNLEQYLQKHGSITQDIALDWLNQIVNILDYIHQRECFHRDIKPSNIMLKPDGKLVLIDFGTARKVTRTVLNGRTITIVYSYGYTPPEQLEGQAVPQSDFFALGRTFVHLLTGQHPSCFKTIQKGRLNWRSRKLQISDNLANLIDQMMAPLPKDRPKDTQEILRDLNNPLCFNLKVKLLINITLILLLSTASSILINWYLTEVNGCSRIWLRLFSKGDHLSCGEEILTPGLPSPEKQAGVEAFAKGNYKGAADWFQKAQQNQGNDPETQIYHNNAQQLATQSPHTYTIAVAVPLTNSKDSAIEMLRGVAQAQDEAVREGLNLRVLIADDANKPIQAEQIARELVGKRDILGIVGHLASEVTLKAVDIYQQNHLVLISSTSTAEELSNVSNGFFFRTVPNDGVAAQALTSYLLKESPQQKVAVFYNPNSTYSKSLLKQFKKWFSRSGGQVADVDEFDISRAKFNPVAAINQVHAKGANTLALFPDAQTSPNTSANIINLIKANKGSDMIVGGDTLYNNDDILKSGKSVARLIVAVPWHELRSPQPTFSKKAEELWRASVSWRTALTYDSTRVLITALKKQNLSANLIEQLNPNFRRDRVQQTLVNSNFQACGATGMIQFQRNGDRKEQIVELVKVISVPGSDSDDMFVPINSSIAKTKSLGCTTQ